MRASAVQSILSESFVRVAVVAPNLRVADVAFNTAEMITVMRALANDGVRLAVFPELGITGYTCADLFYQPPLREAAEVAVIDLCEAASETGVCVVAGLPVEIHGRLYNAAILIDTDGVVGIVPKSFLPTSNEFYEERWFTRAENLCIGEMEFAGSTIPVGADLIFQADAYPDFRLGIEICEDLWTVHPPSGALALAGATVVANPSASNELLGKSGYRRALVTQQSARCISAYLYASAGPGESSTDLVYSGHCMIAENGHVIAEGPRFQMTSTWTVADIDLDFLVTERLKNSSFSADAAPESARIVSFSLGEPRQTNPASTPALKRKLTKRPFVPDDETNREAHCCEIFAIQSSGLCTRLNHLPNMRPVIGLSGGLDSTLALLVCIEALKALGRPASDVLAVSMPGPGSTSHTQSNASLLAETLEVEFREIPIHAAVTQHLKDLSHPDGKFDVTYENAQARKRTQILMDLANQAGGIVVGTGDLSEAALGWCTFNGDQMSMYHVNISVPKSLVRYVIEWAASKTTNSTLAETLRSICDTPITPELLPLAADGGLIQKTEETLGSYDLHDFFLFHVIRRHSSPRKVFTLATLAFDGIFDQAVILATLRTFYSRFFASQFKRSAMPDGPKVGTVALSPRGDWRMPSDAAPALWLEECNELERELK